MGRSRTVSVMIDGQVCKCEVVERMGYVIGVGAHVAAVRHPVDGREIKVLKRGEFWVPWTAQDRIRPMVEHAEREARAGRRWP